MAWDDARKAARASGRRLPAVPVKLAEADRRVLAADVVAATPLPPFRTSIMDGWAVAGDGPWRVVDRVLAGSVHSGTLASGEAVIIATGAAVPEGARGVLRREDGFLTPAGLLSGVVADGQQVRAAGVEAARGEVLAAAGTLLTPAHLGLAAAGGADLVAVVRRPRARVLVCGDELLASGPAGGGRVRDSLGPQLPAWLARLGVDTDSVVRVADTLDEHTAALATADQVDLVVTTGGTAAGPADFVRAAVAATGGELIVDTVAVRPGHPMLLGRWGDRRWLLGLPGNPQAAVVALLTLGVPLVAALAGLDVAPLATVPLAADTAALPGETRLVAACRREGYASAVGYQESSMLRGLTTAEGFAVIPPGGASAGSTVRWLPIPGQKMGVTA